MSLFSFGFGSTSSSAPSSGTPSGGSSSGFDWGDVFDAGQGILHDVLNYRLADKALGTQNAALRTGSNGTALVQTGAGASLFTGNSSSLIWLILIAVVVLFALKK